MNVNFIDNYCTVSDKTDFIAKCVSKATKGNILSRNDIQNLGAQYSRVGRKINNYLRQI